MFPFILFFGVRYFFQFVFFYFFGSFYVLEVFSIFLVMFFFYIFYHNIFLSFHNFRCWIGFGFFYHVFICILTPSIMLKVLAMFFMIFFLSFHVIFVHFYRYLFRMDQVH